MKKQRIIKHVTAVVYVMLVGIPVVLLLDGGPDAPMGHERFGLTNLFGFAWLAFLAFGGLQMITPKWMLDELSAYFGEEEETDVE